MRLKGVTTYRFRAPSGKTLESRNPLPIISRYLGFAFDWHLHR